jgi:hypothetical protein
MYFIVTTGLGQQSPQGGAQLVQGALPPQLLQQTWKALHQAA